MDFCGHVAHKDDEQRTKDPPILPVKRDPEVEEAPSIIDDWNSMRG